MSVSRWIAVAGLSCLALAAAYLPPQPEAERYSRFNAPSTEEARFDLVNMAFRQTQQLLEALRFRDSLHAAVRAAGSRMADVEVAIVSGLPEQSRRAFRSAVEGVWHRTDPPAGARLLVILDATKRPYWHRYVLPRALDDRTCAVSLTLDWNVDWLRDPAAVARGTNLQSWLLDALGPCLYFTTFGQPGPYIEAWLQERWFNLANSADWSGATRTVTRHDAPQMMDMLISNTSFDALACTVGQLRRCRSAIAEVNNRETFRVRPGGFPIAGVVQRTFWPRNFVIDDHYLASLVHDMGRERFSRFWRSPAPVDSAFLAAFGQSMDVWTGHWARAFAPDLPPFGPAPRPIAVLFGFALAAIAVIAAAALVMRRQVS